MMTIMKFVLCDTQNPEIIPIYDAWNLLQAPESGQKLRLPSCGMVHGHKLVAAGLNVYRVTPARRYAAP